jgi:diaminohydroxyphosphoribosylaminopyrimidine deaminase/5-amino-6-(5-phosphoribosylamino)uracil reductase
VIRAALEHLGRRRFTNVLVEGGATVLGSFLDEGEIDEVYAFIAPKLVGGSKAPSPMGGSGVTRMANARRLTACLVEPMGEDWLIRGRFHRPEATNPGGGAEM